MVRFKDCLMVPRKRDLSAKQINVNRTGGNSSPQERPPMKVTVDGEILRRLYGRMLKCRIAGEQARLLGHDSNGTAYRQEAAVAGATIDLLPEDSVSFPTNDVAIQLAVGTPTAQVFAQVLLRSDTTKRVSLSQEPRQSSFRIIPSEACGSSQLSLAAGVALGNKLHGSHNVVLTIHDVNSINLGSSHEALHFAAVHKLPLIVVVETELGADSESSRTQTNLSAKAETYGIPGIAADGNDAVAVYRVAREAINRARSGRGPSLVECRTFDSDMDPISHVERYLAKHGWWTPAWKRQLTEEYKREIDDAIRAAQVLPNKN